MDPRLQPESLRSLVTPLLVAHYKEAAANEECKVTLKVACTLSGLPPPIQLVALRG